MTKTRTTILTLMLVILFSFGICSCGGNNSGNITENQISESISTDEAQQLIDKNKNNIDFVLLDVRTLGEYEEYYIEGSIHRELKDKEEFIASVSDIEKDKRVLIYCRTQNRSRTAYLYMKGSGYKTVQYMDGGITQWAKEGKPLKEPLKNDKTAIIIKDSIPHQYLTTENLVMNISAYNEKKLGEYVNLYKKDIKYTVTDTNANQITSKNITTDGNGKATINLKLNNFLLGSYNMEIVVMDENYATIPSYFDFKIVENKVNENIETYESLKNRGMFNDIIDTNNEYSENFFKHNILKALSGFKVESFSGVQVTLREKMQNLPTLLIFGSPTCGACMDCWEYMSKLNTQDFNVLYILTSINDSEKEKTKREILEILESRNIEIPTNNIYLDSVDYIWRNVLKCKTTPQVVMLDKHGEIVNFLSNDNNNFVSLDAFNESINKVLNKTFSKTLNQREENVNITLVVDDDTKIYTIKKGTSLENIANPNKAMYLFKGWKLNDKEINIETYKFENDATVIAQFERVGILSAEINNYDHVLIDLRGGDKYIKNHLDGAINIPFTNFEQDFPASNIDKNKTIIVYSENEIYDLLNFIKNQGYSAYYIYDYKEGEILELTYKEREQKGEFDSYFQYREQEKNNLKAHYGENYLTLTFKDFDKKVVTLKDKLQNQFEPTIIMLGSTTCGACKQPWNDFLKISKDFKYNFIESIAFGGGNADWTIDNELAKLDESEIEANKKYKVFDINYYYGAGDHPLFTSETPVFYILDKNGNLTNLVSSFSKALECVENLNGSISVKEKSSDNEIKNMKFSDREQSGQFSFIIKEEKLLNMLKNSYGKYVLKESYYNYSHTVKNIGGFLRENDYSFEKPTVMYIINSQNTDFESSLTALDDITATNSLSYNFLIVVDNNSYKHADLIRKQYANKIMFDDYNTNVSTDFVLLDKSYFVVLDASGNVTNAFINYDDCDCVIASTINTKSVLSPNSLTKPSLVKQGDETIDKATAFNNGWISHLDSTKDNARYEYLDVNFGRNYHDFEVIDKNDNNVKLSSIVDNKRPTIVCFLQDYQDDFYYNFTPLMKLKDSANIIIVFTNRKDTPYNQNYVRDIINLAEKKAVEKAKEPQNYDNFKNIVLSNNPSLSGAELNKAVDEYIESVYHYDDVIPYIYGSYAYLTTPLLGTEVRGIQLYLDRNGNLSNISQTYYSVGNTFSSVLNKIGNKIAIETK